MSGGPPSSSRHLPTATPTVMAAVRANLEGPQQEAYAHLGHLNDRILAGCTGGRGAPHNLPGTRWASAAKGAFSQRRSSTTESFKEHQNAELSELAWLNRGSSSGREERVDPVIDPRIGRSTPADAASRLAGAKSALSDLMGPQRRRWPHDIICRGGVSVASAAFQARILVRKEAKGTVLSVDHAATGRADWRRGAAAARAERPPDSTMPRGRRRRRPCPEKAS